MDKLRPLHNMLLVRRAESQDKTPGGLYIPGTAQVRPHRGEVIAAGPGRRLDNGVFAEPQVRVGDVVLFADGIGIEVMLDGSKFVMLSEDAVLGTLS